jgi:hypothetical protein
MFGLVAADSMSMMYMPKTAYMECNKDIPVLNKCSFDFSHCLQNEYSILYLHRTGCDISERIYNIETDNGNIVNPQFNGLTGPKRCPLDRKSVKLRTF